MKNQFSVREAKTSFKDMVKLSIDNSPVYLSLEATGLHKRSDLVHTEMQAMVETLNRYHKIKNYFLLRDLDADVGNNTIGVIGFGKLETTEQKDEFISKLLKVFTEHYDAEDCGIDSIEDFFENYLMYGKEYQSKLWYRQEPETFSISFTIERISFY